MSADPFSLAAGSGLLESWVDPVSGITSRVLGGRHAPIQQSFYFVNPSFSDDGRYLWFYCAYPPGGTANDGRCLGVADFLANEVRVYPETQFLDGSPMVDAGSGEAYWASGPRIWRRGPGSGDPCVVVNQLPAELVRDRRPWRVATHLTFSADRKWLNLDATLGRETHVGRAPVDGGPVEIWDTVHAGFDHGQFSPTDPELQLIAQDSYVDPVTGVHQESDNRLWLIRRGERARPIYTAGNTGAVVQGHSVHHDKASVALADGPRMHGHEWWGADGRMVWFVHYGRGIKRVGLDGLGEELLWPLEFASHAHCDRTGELVVADAQPPQRRDYSKVRFLNRRTGREVDIVSHMPHPGEDIRRYHVHPHPQFTLGDRLICYTTMVRGRVEVALASVAELIAATS